MIPKNKTSFASPSPITSPSDPKCNPANSSISVIPESSPNKAPVNYTRKTPLIRSVAIARINTSSAPVYTKHYLVLKNVLDQSRKQQLTLRPQPLFLYISTKKQST